MRYAAAPPHRVSGSGRPSGICPPKTARSPPGRLLPPRGPGEGGRNSVAHRTFRRFHPLPHPAPPYQSSPLDSLPFLGSAQPVSVRLNVGLNFLYLLGIIRTVLVQHPPSPAKHRRDPYAWRCRKPRREWLLPRGDMEVIVTAAPGKPGAIWSRHTRRSTRSKPSTACAAPGSRPSPPPIHRFDLQPPYTATSHQQPQGSQASSLALAMRDAVELGRRL